MPNPVPPTLSASLLRLAATPGWRRHLAYTLLGLALMLGILRPRVPSPAPSGRAVVFGMLLATGLLILAGPVLGSLQPVFKGLGRLPGWGLLLGGVAVLLAVAHRKGQRFVLEGSLSCAG